jgi:hypothetical protein
MQYPDWRIYQQLLIDGYPLLVLEKDGEFLFTSEGYYQNIIEFLLPLSEPIEDYVIESGSVRVWSIHNQLHQAFMSGEGFADGVIYFELQPIPEIGMASIDSELQQEIDRYQQQAGHRPTESFWHVSPNFAGWRDCGRYIPQSSINKMIQVSQQIKAGDLHVSEGVQILSEDEWDLHFT